MLLTIHNLPYTVSQKDIKTLIHTKCGISEIILDNLVPHENRTKKITVGFTGEEDAAIFTKTIDGYLYKGHQLRVVSKGKIPAMSQRGAPDAMQSLMSQASAYSQGQNFGAPLLNAPTMVPPPMNFGTPNVFYPNQSAYYMMNQSTYPSTSSLPNVGYQTVPFGNAGNQGYAQKPWSDNTWNQQQQPKTEVSKKSPPKKDREVNWNKGGSNAESGNNNTNWDSNQFQWDNSNSNWDNSNTNWDNSNTNWDTSNTKRGNSNTNRGNSNTNWDNSNRNRGNSNTNSGNSNTNRGNNYSKWDDSNTIRGNNSSSKWDDTNTNRGNSYSKWDDSNTIRGNNSSSKWDNTSTNRGNSNSKWEASNSQRVNNQSSWENNQAPNRDNRRESRWNNSGDDSNWNSHNDPRSNTSRDLNWQNSREFNRDITFRSNQRTGTSRDRDSPNRSFNRNYSPRPSDNIYGDHVRNPEQDNRPRDNEPQQNRFRSPQRQRTPNKRDRPRNRNRNSKPIDARKDPPTKRELQIGRLWRGQFIATKARNIMEDPRFEYECPAPGKLLSTLTSNIKRRVRINFEDDYSMPMNQLEKKYNKIYGFHGDWVVLRDSLEKVGGRLLSKVDADAGGEPCKTIKKNKKALRQGAGDINQEEPHYDEYPQASTAMIGNVQQGPSQPWGSQPRGQQPQGPQPRGPQPRGPQAQGPQPRGPQPRGLQPRGPQPRGPQARGPQAQGPQPRGPQTRGPQPRGPQPRGPQPRGPQQAVLASHPKNNPMGIPLALIPGRIPHYPQGDKQLFKQNKKETKEILTGDLSSPQFNCLRPNVKNAIEKEVDLMCTMIDKVCETTGKDAILPDFCQVLKGEVAEEMRRVLRVILARRIIPILPVKLRVFASPPIKRPPLEDFLKDFNVSALKKSKLNAYFIVDCNTIEDHDKLCTIKDRRIGNSIVNFKPLHLVNSKKIPKKVITPKFSLPTATEAAKNTEIEAQMKDEPINEGVDDNNDDYEVEENWVDENMDTDIADVGQDQDLCHKMKNIYDQINKTEPNEIEEDQTHDIEEFHEVVEQSNEEAYQAFQSVQATDSEDFTADVDLDNIMGQLCEVANNEHSTEDQGVDENNANETVGDKQGDETIDMVDVNEEDLEDY